MAKFLSYFIGTIVLLAVSLATFMYFQLGFYKEPRVLGAQQINLNLIYKQQLGPSHEISPLLSKIEAEIAGQNIDCAIPFGEYLDDPASMDPERLRSNLGCVIESDKVPLIDGFTTEKREGNYLVIEFEGSPGIGPYKAYPEADNWFQQQGKPRPATAIETYKPTGDGELLTTYYFKVEG